MNFVSAMENEHCSRSGAKEEFETKNYEIKTTPSKEWKIVRGEIKCPEDQIEHGRSIPKIGDLQKLDIAIEAKLQEPEIIAVVLYTGPMVDIKSVPFLFMARLSVDEPLCCST